MTADPIDIVVEDPRWETLDLTAISAAAYQALCSELGVTHSDYEFCILACNDARIAELNTEFRDKSTATNVLSWPAEDLSPDTAGATPQRPMGDGFPGPISLGDIAISLDTCLAEATAAVKPVPDHLAHLTMHAILHLFGYDHVNDSDATLMENIETSTLAKMGIEDPY